MNWNTSTSYEDRNIFYGWRSGYMNYIDTVNMLWISGKVPLKLLT